MKLIDTQRQVLGDPGARGVDARADIAIVGGDLAGDQREEALGVGVAFDECQVIAEVGVERRQILDHAVVGEQPSVLLERVGVAQRSARPWTRSGRGRRKCSRRPRAPRARTPRPRKRRSAACGRAARPLVKPAQARPVRLAVALRGEAVRRLEQPERRPRGPAPGAHAEQAAHFRLGGMAETLIGAGYA